MAGNRPLRGLLAGLAALLAPAIAHAAPVQPDRQARGFVVITAPAQVRKLEDLNFATLSVWSAGTATVNPNDDTITTTGGVVHTGGTPYSALFEAVSPVKNVVLIRIPKQPITITRVGGTETMTVENFTLDGVDRRNVVARELFTFKVGGTLNVNADQAEGLYVGTFDVQVQFP